MMNVLSQIVLSWCVNLKTISHCDNRILHLYCNSMLLPTLVIDETCLLHWNKYNYYSLISAQYFILLPLPFCKYNICQVASINRVYYITDLVSFTIPLLFFILNCEWLDGMEIFYLCLLQPQICLFSFLNWTTFGSLITLCYHPHSVLLLYRRFWTP